MLWAIDVGNTHTVIGLRRDDAWRALWRLPTQPEATEDSLAADWFALCGAAGLPFEAQGAIVASVVPQLDPSIARLAQAYWGIKAIFLTGGASVGMEVRYRPPEAVGADRIANALGALSLATPPLVVVDFGTATTLDVISADGAYLGGAILPGPQLALEALVGRTAKLPSTHLRVSPSVIGATTDESLRSGLVRGTGAAIEGLIAQIREELGSPVTVLATGGLAEMFAPVCPSIAEVCPELTLNGLLVARDRLAAFSGHPAEAGSESARRSGSDPARSSRRST